jgi:hypothetical protein
VAPAAAEQVIINTPDASLQVAAPPVLEGFTEAPAAGGAASAAQSAGGATAADTTSLTGYDITDTSKLPKDAVLTGDMEVVYLPDLDEQYVIRSKNFLAKSAFALTFANGSELTQVQGEHDATTVTIALLDLIQTAIGVASQVAQQQVGQKSSATSGQQAAGTTRSNAPGPEAKERLRADQLVDPTAVYQMTERIYIRPGVYRLNKPWEITQPGCDPPTGFGLLAKIGLPHESDVYFEKVATKTGGL